MKVYIVIATRNYETEILGIFGSLELAKIEQRKKSRYHYIQEFVLNEPSTGKIYFYDLHRQPT